MYSTVQKLFFATLFFSLGLLYVRPVFSIVGDVQLDVSTGGQIIGSALMTNKFTDAANTDYYLDPAAATTSLTVAGSVGIGTTAPPGKLSTVNDLTNNGSSYNLYSAVTKRATANGTYYNQGLHTNSTILVDSGITDSGYWIGVDSGTLRSSASDVGTLNSLLGQRLQIGHYTGTATARTTTNAYGILADMYYMNGTINNLYGIYIAGTGGGTVTNNYGLYQADSNAKNYFGGNVGIGTTGPGWAVETYKNAADVAMVVHSAGYARGGIAALKTGNRSVALFTTTSGDPINIGYSGATESTLGSSFVSRMFIDNSTGNVGIGTTGPGAKLQISAGDAAAANAQLIVSGGRSLGANALGSAGSLLFTNSYWDANKGSAAIYGLDTGSSGGGLVFATVANNSGTTGAPTAKMIIDQAGNVGIGAGTPNVRLDINTTSASGYDGIALYQNTDNESTIQSYIDSQWSNRATYAGGCCNTLKINPDVGTVWVAGVGGGQGVYINHGQTAWNSGSDQRLKTNVQSLSNNKGLASIMQLNPVTFNWIDTNSNQSIQTGFIAQQIQNVFPDLVSSDGATTTITLPDGSKQTITNPLGINYQGLIPYLVKGIQEQQKQIISLKNITTDFISKFKEGLIETKKLIVDGVDIVKKLDTQQKEIDDLKKEIDELKKK